MNYKIKKSYYRLFSVLLSLVMIVLSVPMTVAAEEDERSSIIADNNINVESTLVHDIDEIALKEQQAEEAKQALSESQVNSSNVELLSSTPITSDVIPDGIYAIKNVGNPTMYFDTRGDSPMSGRYMQQYAYATNPSQTTSSNLAKGGLFKIQRVGTTNKYIVRLMTNNGLSFGASSSGVTTREISTVDSEVSAPYTFAFEKSPYGYYIKPFGSAYAISAPNNQASGASTDDSKLLRVLRTQVTTRGEWMLYPYEGASMHEVSVYLTPSEMIVGETSSIFAYTTNTQIGKNGPITYSVINTDGTTPTRATINSSTGEIYARAPGQIKITAVDSSTSVSTYRIFTITHNAEGTYFFNNVEYPNKYVQIDNNNDMLGEEIIELHRFLGYDYQIWNVEYISNGYYKIISEYSNISLTAPTGAGNNVVRQTTYTGAYTQLWKFIRQSNGTYKISPRSNLNYFLAAGDESSAADQDLEIRTNQSDGRDEWNLTEIQYTANVLNYYDMGYPVRYGESTSVASSKINSYIDMVGRQYLRLFGLELTPFNATYYQSPLDLCKGTVTSNNIDNLCSHSGIVHSERSNVISDFNSSHVGDSKTTYVLWSCHKITSTATSGVINYNRSCSSGTGIFLIAINTSNRDQKSQAVLMHELNHQYGARDHYHELADPNDYNSCKFKDICSKCGDNKRPSSCIMNTTSVDINSDSVICQPCIEEILAYLSDHQ